VESKKLEILMTAVDLGSFSKASEAVGYTQSGLTHLVDSLEREIGFRIVQRNHNGISLTSEGKKLMPAIREFLRANANLENQIEQIGEQKGESIRIAAYASIAMRWMPEILYRFRRVCPDVNVDLRMVDHALEPFELLEQGKTDVIFASRQKFKNCAWLSLYNEPMYAILPRNYPVGDEKTFPLEKFAGCDFIMPYGRFDLDINAALSKVGVRLDVKPSRVDDETVIRMVSKGLGISMMSELMIRGNIDDVLCLPVEPAAIRELGMGMLPEKEGRGSLEKLKNCVLDFIKEKRGQN